MIGDLDAGTRSWWRLVGRRIDLAGDEAWLSGPMSATSVIDTSWQEQQLVSAAGRLVAGQAGSGLIADLSALDGPGFDASRLHPAVREFYEHTADWRMDVWSQWSWWARPGGEAIARLFGRRVQQLALPTRSMDVAYGMDSAVAVVKDAAGSQLGAIWVRTLRRTADTVFSGYYTVGKVPAAPRPSVHVTFPLQDGNVQVFLRPTVDDSGALLLESPPPGVPRGFGTEGAYVTVRSGSRVDAATVPLVERFRVFVDDVGVLRCDHALRLWTATALRLHYRLERAAG